MVRCRCWGRPCAEISGAGENIQMECRHPYGELNEQRRKDAGAPNVRACRESSRQQIPS
jgi:hypothetical protein